MPIIDFKATMCKHCYKCVRGCEVKSIMIRDGHAYIMPNRCILCGQCRAKVPVPLPDLSASIRQNGSFTVIQTSRFARASHYSHYQFVTYHYLHYHCQPRTYAPSLFKMLS